MDRIPWERDALLGRNRMNLEFRIFHTMFFREFPKTLSEFRMVLLRPFFLSDSPATQRSSHPLPNKSRTEGCRGNFERLDFAPNKRKHSPNAQISETTSRGGEFGCAKSWYHSQTTCSLEMDACHKTDGLFGLQVPRE